MFMEKFIVKKKFGQNFLKNDLIIEKIVNSIEVNHDDLIIEVGPGKGALTKKLVKKGCKVIAFEIDKDTYPYLKDLENDNFSLIYDDFLNIDVNSYLSDYQYHDLYIVANLPYYITTPIITKIIDDKLCPKAMILMVQKEVADRFSAKPGSKDYGYFTVKLNYYFAVEKLFNVKKTEFNPVPKVDSAVVSFKIKDYDKNLAKKFDNFIKDAFKMKRKTLKNNLGSDLFNKVLPILMEAGFGSDVRAEQIDLETFIKMVKET